jgi:hypothetical protein
VQVPTSQIQYLLDTIAAEIADTVKSTNLKMRIFGLATLNNSAIIEGIYERDHFTRTNRSHFISDA